MKNEPLCVTPTLFMLINSKQQRYASSVLVLFCSSQLLSPPIFCCTYCWFICAGAAWSFFFSLSSKWLCLLYVSVCGWLWRNHGMLYNDDTFQFCINLRVWWVWGFGLVDVAAQYARYRARFSILIHLFFFSLLPPHSIAVRTWCRTKTRMAKKSSFSNWTYGKILVPYVFDPKFCFVQLNPIFFFFFFCKSSHILYYPSTPSRPITLYCTEDNVQHRAIDQLHLPEPTNNLSLFSPSVFIIQKNELWEKWKRNTIEFFYKTKGIWIVSVFKRSKHVFDEGAN